MSGIGAIERTIAEEARCLRAGRYDRVAELVSERERLVAAMARDLSPAEAERVRDALATAHARLGAAVAGLRGAIRQIENATTIRAGRVGYGPDGTPLGAASNGRIRLKS
ncbi:MAG: hypothetical protein ACPGID_06000 [Rubricella sp.]